MQYRIEVYGWYDADEATRRPFNPDNIGTYWVESDNRADADYEASELLDNDYGVHDYYDFRCLQTRG